MSKAKSVSVEVLPPAADLAVPTEPKLLPVAIWGGSEVSLATRIHQEMEATERLARASVYTALRVGIVLGMIKESGHGNLGKFLESHFKSKCRATLTKYQAVANAFLNKAKLKDAQHKITDAKAVSPLLEAQPDLFLSPDAQQLQGVLKEAHSWVNGRGLNQIFRDLAATGKKSLPPAQHGNDGNHDKRKITPQQRREEALETVGEMKTFCESDDWKFLHLGELGQLANHLADFSAAVKKQVADLERKQAKLDRTAKGKGTKS